MSADGILRLDRSATPPWQYRGEVVLPAGRRALIEARVAEDAAGKHFILRVGLIAGMSAEELEKRLAEIEAAAAARAQLDGSAVWLLRDDELPF
jgi:hypothetical protein